MNGSNSNLSNPARVRFVPHDVGSGIVVNAGAAGWIDTDVSAQTGTDIHKVWLIHAFEGAEGAVGARQTGSVVDNFVTASKSTALMAHCDSAGHMDLYRNAASNVNYKFVGYLETY